MKKHGHLQLFKLSLIGMKLNPQNTADVSSSMPQCIKMESVYWYKHMASYKNLQHNTLYLWPFTKIVRCNHYKSKKCTANADYWNFPHILSFVYLFFFT